MIVKRLIEILETSGFIAIMNEPLFTAYVFGFAAGVAVGAAFMSIAIVSMLVLKSRMKSRK